MNEKLLEIYRIMIRIRTFEKAVRELGKKGIVPTRIGFYTGQEAVATGVCSALRETDQIGSTHRPLGHLIAKGCDLKKLMAEICGKETGFNKGKAGPYHIFDPSVGALGANGIVGGSVPMVVGYALVHQLRKDNGVAVAFFGEGAANQGGVLESMNLASVWNLPLVFVCENSSPDIQTMLGHKINYPQLSIENVSSRAVGFGMHGATYEGWDVMKVYRAALEAVEKARGGGGPTLLEFKVHQLIGSIEEGIEATENESMWDPIQRFRRELMFKGALNEEEDRWIRTSEELKVKEAVEYATGSPDPDADEALKGVFTEE
ncbi:MAG: thiamine pyrophosphate-dependent dehydrogenase E1 component subunit alpha [Candidatus Bathyarchaeia archaeon]